MKVGAMRWFIRVRFRLNRSSVERNWMCCSGRMPLIRSPKKPERSKSLVRRRRMSCVSKGSVRMIQGRDRGFMKTWVMGLLWRVVRDVSQHYRNILWLVVILI